MLGGVSTFTSKGILQQLSICVDIQAILEMRKMA